MEGMKDIVGMGGMTDTSLWCMRDIGGMGGMSYGRYGWQGGKGGREG